MNDRTRRALIEVLNELKYEAASLNRIIGAGTNTTMDACDKAIEALLSDETILEVN